MALNAKIPKIIPKAAAPNVLIVDPNPTDTGKTGRSMHTPEDMFIYVKFTAYNRDRSTWVTDPKLDDKGKFIGDNNLGVLGEIDFIATQVNYNQDSGKVDPSPQKTYSTTNYTNIGGLTEPNSRGVLEGFGIKNIDIKYNASLVPVVDMTFTDVRGASLFDTISADERRSPYSIFFKMPYPIFKLSVKGYFGKTVNYCLHMINWTSNFDGTSGNFDISANFIGFQQAFLNDMVIGNIIGTVNTQQGFDILNGIYDEEEEVLRGGVTQTERKRYEQEGKPIPNHIPTDVRKLDDLFLKVSKLQMEFKDIKENSPEFDKLKALNTQKSKLKKIRAYIGYPLSKSKEDQSGDFEKQANDSTQVYTSQIESTSLEFNSNYLSIRDFIVFKSINTVSIKNYIITLNDMINDYKSFLVGDEVKGIIDEKESTDLIDSFWDTGTEDNYKKFLILWTEKPVPLLNVVENFEQSAGGLLVQSYEKTGSGGNNPNASFDPSLYYNKQNRSNWIGTPKAFNLTNNVQVLDLRKCRAKVQSLLIDVGIQIDVQRAYVEIALNDKLVKSLGFNPSIRDIFRVICNNTQAMLTTINHISQSAENKSNEGIRNDSLKRYITDIPSTTETSYAWPSVYEKSDDKGTIEIYLGEVPGINPSVFPELQFVEKVYKNFIGKQKELSRITKESVSTKGVDNENWYPINPLDYKTNPFSKINKLNDRVTILMEITRQLFLRSTVLNTYSQFKTPLTTYAEFDGIVANKAIYNKNVRNFIKNNLTLQQVIESGIEGNIIWEEKINGTDYYVLDEIFPWFMSGWMIGGNINNLITQSEVDYIILDDSNIVNNATALPAEITNLPRYKKIVEKENSQLTYINYYSSSRNFTSKLGYNVWFSEIGTVLVGLQVGDPKKILKKYKISNFNSINSPINYINVLNANKGLSQTPPTSKYLIGGDFYENQVKESKALLLLATFPFRTFKDAVLNTFGDNKCCRIIELPTFYLYYIGGLLWRQNSDTDPISWGAYTDLKTDKDNYFTNLGALNYQGYISNSTTAPKKLEDALIKLPPKTKSLLIDKFLFWVKYEYTNFEFLIKNSAGPLIDIPSPVGTGVQYTYVTGNIFDNTGNISGINVTVSNNIDLPMFTKQYSHVTFTEQSAEAAIKFQMDNIPINFINNIEYPKTGTPIAGKVPEYGDYGQALTPFLEKVTNMILPTSMILFPDDTSPENLTNGLIIKKEDFESYYKSFEDMFVFINEKNEKGEESSTDNEIEKGNSSEIDVKLQIYSYFKNINNKWACSDNVVNTCGPDGPLIDSFKFINRGWGDIGDSAVINLNSLLSLGDNQNTSVYFFIAKILRDSNFLLQILPNYINFKDPQEVIDMFTPIPNVNDENSTSGPQYVCVYGGGGTSKQLDIKEENKYYFPNDGFSFSESSDLPVDIKPDNNQKLVAFRVAFGAENQTLFKNISLNQQEHRETAEYFRALAQTVDKRGGTQRTYQGNDLYNLFQTRSYTCKVDALGCATIQPLMYFDLQNVPFFKGAYWITGVQHNITPNHMTTSFTGVRQSKFQTKPIDSPTLYLDINLNEDLNLDPIKFTNKTNKNDVYSIGITDGLEDEPFAGLTIEILRTLGVKEEDIDEGVVKQFNLTLKSPTFGINTNSEAIMFIANVLANSNYMSQKEQSWSVPGDKKEYIVYETDNSGELTTNPKKYTNQPTGDNIVYDPPGNDTQNQWRPINTQPLTKTSEGDLAKFLGNEEPGDGYRFRPRGYLPLLGKKMYGRALGGTYKKSPDTITSTPAAAFRVAAWMWTQFEGDLKGETANGYAQGKDSEMGKGNSASFMQTILISQMVPDIQKSFEIFEKVLNIYNVLSYDKP